MKWLWAAYNKGAFENLIPRDLDRDTFRDTVYALLSQVHDVHLLIAPNEGERRPVGMMTVNSGQYAVEPHVHWFPWATSRNKIETVAKWLNEIRHADVKALAWPRETERAMFDRLTKAGILTLVGRVPGLFENRGNAMLYVTQEPD